LKFALAITCFEDRYKYLYVTLDSIYKMEHIELLDVYVYLVGEQLQPNIYKVCSEFPIKSITSTIYRSIDEYFYVLNELFNTKTYDMVIMSADDIIFRSDTLAYLLSLDNSVFMDFLCPHCLECNGKIVCEIGDNGHVFRYSNFQFMRDSFKAGFLSFVKLPREDSKGSETILNRFLTKPNYKLYIDAFMCSIVHYNKALCRFPKTPYVAHFGFKGFSNIISNVDKVEEIVFSGDKSTWLSNILSFVKTESFLSLEGMSRAFYPKDFDYEVRYSY